MPDTLTLDIQKVTVNDQNVYQISLAGEVDTMSLEIIHKKIDELLGKDGMNSILFDVANLYYINSKFVGYLLAWHSKAQSKNGKVILIGAKDHILDVLDVQGVLHLVPSCLTFDEAKLLLS